MPKWAWVSAVVIGSFLLIGGQFRCSGSGTQNGPGFGITPPVPQTVFAGGSMGANGWPAPGYWVNGTWVALPALSPGIGDTGTLGPFGGDVNALAIDSLFGNVYAAGDNYNSTGVDVPGYWLNGVWNGLTPLDPTQNSSILSLAVSGETLYAAGYSSQNGLRVPGYWTIGPGGTTWTPLTLRYYMGVSPDGQANSIRVTGSHVCIAGWLNSTDTIACYWVDGVLVLPTFQLAASPPVASLASSISTNGNQLFAAGFVNTLFFSSPTTPGYWQDKINAISSDFRGAPTATDG